MRERKEQDRGREEEKWGECERNRKSERKKREMGRGREKVGREINICRRKGGMGSEEMKERERGMRERQGERKRDGET